MDNTRTRLRNLALIGLVMVIVGFAIDAALGSVAEIQAASSPEEFARIAHDQGNDLRWAGWIDIVIIVTGYVLMLASIFIRWRLPTATARQRQIATVGLVALAIAAVADQCENLMVQLGIGLVDLDAAPVGEMVDPADWIISLLQLSFGVKWLGLAVALLAVIACAALHLIGRRARATTAEA